MKFFIFYLIGYIIALVITLPRMLKMNITEPKWMRILYSCIFSLLSWALVILFAVWFCYDRDQKRKDKQNNEEE